MHIITPAWLERLYTICTLRLRLMFYAHTNKIPRAKTMQVMFMASLIKTEREWTFLVAPWQLLFHYGTGF